MYLRIYKINITFFHAKQKNKFKNIIILITMTNLNNLFKKI